MREQLEQVLRPVLGTDVAVENLRTLTGGASRITSAFDAVTGGTRRPLILRAAPTVEGQFASMKLEAAVQSAAADAGAPVPHILIASNSAAPLGNPFLVCDEIAGETIVRKIQRGLDDAGRARLLTQCGAALAAIHRARADAPELVERDELTEWRQRLDDLPDTTATFEWAFRWLAANRPDPGPRTLTHGDFRMGNLIVDCPTPAEPNLAAVLDWEAVHIGDMHEDLAWFCVRAWRFGAPASMAAGGLGTVEEFVAAYEQAGGVAVDREALRWWLVLGTLKWGIICRYQAERHLSGQTRSVELAAIGRRVCENEWDILDLLVESTILAAEPAEEKPGSQPGACVTNGRPTAAELVAAVAEFLEGEFRAATTGAVNFHALVAANALRIVERELLDTGQPAALSAIAALGYPDEQALAAAIRAGKLDGRAEELLAGLRAVVGARLAVAHPGYAGE